MLSSFSNDISFTQFLFCLGITVNVPEIGQQVVKGLLISAVLDLPAKAALLNCHQYNGEYGCSTCKHPGITVRYIIEANWSINYCRLMLEEGLVEHILTNHLLLTETTKVI